MSITSPLTGSNNVILKRKISCHQLIKNWQNDFNIDISNELGGEESIIEYQCKDTGLYFFYPGSVVGSSHVYEQLQKFDWYYNPDKWEHKQILSRVKSGMRVLEIGCGEGSFLEKCKIKGAEAIGLELNEVAVQVGQKKGLNITNEYLEQFADRNLALFDIVCCFQVLEHIPNPKEFISQCLKVAKPEGLIIFGVPNAESFLGKSFSILDLPPHHMLRWSRRTFKKLESLFPVSLEKIKFEPLAIYHIDWFQGLLKKERGVLGFLYRIKVVRSISTFLLKLGGRSLINGHTVLAIFKKTT